MANAGVFHQSQLLEPRTNTAQVWPSLQIPAGRKSSFVFLPTLEQLGITMSDATHYPPCQNRETLVFQFLKNKFEKLSPRTASFFPSVIHLAHGGTRRCTSSDRWRYSLAYQLRPLAVLTGAPAQAAGNFLLRS